MIRCQNTLYTGGTKSPRRVFSDIGGMLPSLLANLWGPFIAHLSTLRNAKNYQQNVFVVPYDGPIVFEGILQIWELLWPSNFRSAASAHLQDWRHRTPQAPFLGSQATRVLWHFHRSWKMNNRVVWFFATWKGSPKKSRRLRTFSWNMKSKYGCSCLFLLYTIKHIYNLLIILM